MSSSSLQMQLSSLFWGRDLCRLHRHACGGNYRKGICSSKVYAMSSSSSSGNPVYKMNLNEYMVTLDKPLGIRFALSLDGKVFVHALKKGGNADRSRIIMVGDTLKKARDSSSSTTTDSLNPINDFGETVKILLEKTTGGGGGGGAFSLGNGNSGFVTFSSKFLTPHGWNKLFNHQIVPSQQHNINLSPLVTQIVSIFTEQEPGDGEWSHGSFPLEEYIKALNRSKGELYYNHSLGTGYSKVTEQIYVGSCIQTQADVENLSKLGVTAVLNFQSGIEAENWGINSNLINESCQRFNILMINYPIRDADSFDMRKKLPFCVGLLLRLLKKNHRVFVTCTTGFDRSPACVIAYLHWMTDTSLHAAYNFITGLHSCRPDRPAIAWATWDLIAMVEKDRHEGPATHALTFVWTGQEGEEVSLVGDFTGNWKEPMKATHKGGPRYEVEVRLPQGKYYYKYIINGQWRHSTASPTERDERGNLNNVVVVGDIASVRPSIQQQKKDINIVKVIERPLTENERFMLAKAARCVAFSVCPIRLAPK
ncbi:hypothetical protein OIU77_016155 [Salix suchowensis]|uniref:Tyrosine-protein phosphatase domain-containing protein n=1 Tax=Salix suchowensis TaxID=1278906 RepID=A0ABQ8ZJE3_9ROSI|nr:hypothetical protein OIU77_016155 [Salix suchowensis]KAJ6314651.1 hypothetical protein OIU78_018181 [Salix suchowensis]